MLNYISTISPYKLLHAVGCCLLCFIAWEMTFTALYGALIASFFGFLWELADQANMEYKWNVKWLDPTGGDMMDFASDILGVALACTIKLLIVW